MPAQNVVAVDAGRAQASARWPAGSTNPRRATTRPCWNDTDVQGYADIRSTGQNDLGLDVLAGNRASDQPRPLVPSMFTGVLSRLRRTHTVIVVDTSDDLEHPVMKAVLDACDTLVFVVRPDRRHFAAGHPCHRSAAVAGYHELVSRSIIILNDSRNKIRPGCTDLSHRTLWTVRSDGRVHALRSLSREGRDNRYPARAEETDTATAIRDHTALADKYIQMPQAALMTPLLGKVSFPGPMRGCGRMW